MKTRAQDPKTIVAIPQKESNASSICNKALP